MERKRLAVREGVERSTRVHGFGVGAASHHPRLDLPFGRPRLTLTNPACDAIAIVAHACKVFARDQSNAKPAQITMLTTANAYRPLVFNRGPQTESGTITVTVTQIRFSP